MKKLITISLIILLNCICSKTYAQVILTKDLAKIIENKQIQELQEQGYKDIEVSVINIPIEKLTIPDGEVSVKINSNASEFTSREYKKIDILVNSKYARSIGVPIGIKIYKNVLVAKDTIMRDGSLNSGNLTTKREDILTLTQQTLDEKDLATDFVSLRMYKAGDIIDKRFTKSKPDIVKNAIVTVIFKTGDDMNITVEGIALTDGKIGNYIAIQNKNYKKTYTGKVIGTNKVLVQI